MGIHELTLNEQISLDLEDPLLVSESEQTENKGIVETVVATPPSTAEIPETKEEIKNEKGGAVVETAPPSVETNRTSS